MYHNSVVNSRVNIYLISLLAQPRQFQIQIREFSLAAFSAQHGRKVAQIIPLWVKTLPFSSFFSPLLFIFYYLFLFLDTGMSSEPLSDPCKTRLFAMSPFSKQMIPDVSRFLKY